MIMAVRKRSPSYMNSKKFLMGDGGWDRVFWMPKSLVDKFAPRECEIATEEDVVTLADLKGFLKTHNLLDRDNGCALD